ncbi:MAG TPA: VWA domain-containing protein [Acidobacteriaceae bacterium]
MRYSAISTCFALCLLFLAVCSAYGAGQAPSASTVFHVRSRLVVLDVVVTGKDGQLVPGLIQQDFQVLEDGKPQKIRSVEFTASTSAPASHSKSVLVLDELNNAVEESNHAKAELEHYISTLPEILLQPTMLIAVNDQGFQMLSSTTRDREGLQRALHAERSQIPFDFNRHDYEARLRITLNALRQIALSSEDSPGRTELIWVGHGFPSVNLENVDATLSDAMQTMIRKITNVLLEARIVVYRIDPAPVGSGHLLESPENMDAAFDDSTEPFAENIGFDTLVRQTGGTAFYNRNDVDNEVARAVTLGSTFYTVTYIPANDSAEPASYRHIRVVMNRPGLHASTRQGYYTDTQQTTQPAPDVPLTVDAAIVNDLNYTSLQIRVSRYIRSGDGHSTIYRLQLAPQNLQWSVADDGSRTLHLMAAAASYTAAHKPRSYTRRSILLKFSANQDALAPISLDLPLHIPADATSLRVVVLDTSSGKLGSTNVDPLPVNARTTP